MSEPRDPQATARLANSLADIDLEVARLALVCQVPILDPGVADRVLLNDASVCGTSNPLAFDKLRNLLAMHFAVRESAGVGQAQAARVEQHVIDRLRARFPGLAGDPLV